MKFGGEVNLLLEAIHFFSHKNLQQTMSILDARQKGIVAWEHTKFHASHISNLTSYNIVVDITLFRSITMLCGIDIILKNILCIQHE